MPTARKCERRAGMMFMFLLWHVCVVNDPSSLLEAPSRCAKAVAGTTCQPPESVNQNDPWVRPKSGGSRRGWNTPGCGGSTRETATIGAEASVCHVAARAGPELQAAAALMTPPATRISRDPSNSSPGPLAPCRSVLLEAPPPPPPTPPSHLLP